MHKVSVIICSRNREELCRVAVASARAMNRPGQVAREIIVIDDNSEEPYGSVGGVIPVRNDTRRGLAYSRNLGAELASGEFIMFLDDDNQMLPGFIEQALPYLQGHPEEDAVAVGRVVEYPEGTAYQPPVVNGSMNDGFLIRRKAFLDIKCDPELTANEDADFGIRFHKKYKVGAIHKPLMRVWASPVINTTSYSDYSDYHLDGLARFWLKHHAADYRKYIGRMFLLAAGSPKWFKWLYYLETKMKRYWQILKWKLCS